MDLARAGAHRFEITLLAVFSAAWLLAIGVLLGWVPVAGTLQLGLYGYYSFAAALGWVNGNVYVARRRRLPPSRFRRQVLLGYLVGPLSFLYILRAFASKAAQTAAPLVPIYGFVVYWLFFLVPVTLRASRPTRGPS